MNPHDLEKYLHDHIPLSAAMQVSVIDISADYVMLGAPLAPNINHRDTVFGGSAASLAILAAWAVLHTRLAAVGLQGTLVIQRSTMNYTKAIAGNFLAKASAPAPNAWQVFLRTLQRKGRGRITLTSELLYEAEIVGQFSGEFVALGVSKA
jgi:thioesterase domain-containing protein